MAVWQPHRHGSRNGIRSRTLRVLTSIATFGTSLWRNRRLVLFSGLLAFGGCDSSPKPAPASVTVGALDMPSAMSRWSALLNEAPSLADRKFYFVMAASAISQGGLKEVDKQYPAYYSRTMRIGVAVPILYLRTTFGATGDWKFDPNFSMQQRCRGRAVAEDSLNGLIRFALDHQMPVQFILNGGVL